MCPPNLLTIIVNVANSAQLAKSTYISIVISLTKDGVGRIGRSVPASRVVSALAHKGDLQRDRSRAKPPTAERADAVSQGNGLRDEGSVGVVVAYRSDTLSEVRAEECDRFFCDTRSYT